MLSLRPLLEQVSKIGCEFFAYAQGKEWEDDTMWEELQTSHKLNTTAPHYVQLSG